MNVSSLKNGEFNNVGLEVRVSSTIDERALSLINRVALQNLKQGTKKAKGRSEVSGTSAKPFRQKGTGNARQGSRKGPHMRGGGVAHGPKPDYRKLKLNKKFKKKSLKEILASYLREGSVVFIDFNEGKETLKKKIGDDKSLLIYDPADSSKVKWVRNLPNLSALSTDSMGPANLLNYHKIYIDINAKERLSEILS